MSSRSVPKEFLGAFKQGHRRNTREFIDHDYTEDLLRRAKAGALDAIEALQFLTKFNNEYYKKVLKKGDPEALHDTSNLRSDCYGRGNSIERDIFANFRRYKNADDVVDIFIEISVFST